MPQLPSRLAFQETAQLARSDFMRRIQELRDYVEALDSTSDSSLFMTRTAFEEATIPAPVQQWGVMHPLGFVLKYFRDPNGTAIISANGVAGSPLGDVYPDHWAENVNPGVTNMAPAAQAAIDWIRTFRGGGVVRMAASAYGFATRVFVWERVTLVGEAGIARNWWQLGGEPIQWGGTVIWGIDTFNNALIDVTLSNYFEEPGQPGENIPQEPNTDRRHGGGVQRLAINGASLAQHCLAVTGANVPIVRDVIMANATSHGMITRSSGFPDGQCNNQHYNRIIAFSCGGNGFSLSGGDNQISELWGINNGINGATITCGSSIFHGCYFNNNGQAGFFSSGNDCDFVGVTCYHNARNGCTISGPRASLVGVKCRHNGTDTTTGVNNRCGIVLTATAEDFLITGCAAYDEGFKGDPDDRTQQKGFRILSTRGLFGTNTSWRNVVIDEEIPETITRTDRPSAEQVGDLEADWIGQGVEPLTASLLSLQSSIALNEMDAADAPGVSNDETEGYSVGSLWRVTSGPLSGRVWICYDATEDAAIWQPLTGHPIVASASIDLNDFHLLRARSITFRQPVTVSSVTGNVLNLVNSSTVTLNVAGGATVNSMEGAFTSGLGIVYIRNINSSPVTFTNGSAIRTKSGSNLVLEQNRGVTFKEFAAGTWFEV